MAYDAIVTLIEAVIKNDAKEAYAFTERLTRSELTSLAYWLQETATFVRRVAKDRDDSYGFPAENEE